LTRDELARDLEIVTTTLVLALGALERLTDDLRRPEEEQVPAPSVRPAPDRTET